MKKIIYIHVKANGKQGLGLSRYPIIKKKTTILSGYLSKSL